MNYRPLTINTCRIGPVNHPRDSGRIVIATIGSLGDLHPCLALGRVLSERGHKVTIATTPYYRSKVESSGLSFHSMRPDWDPADARMIRSCENLQRGLEVLYRQIVLPELEHTYADLLSVAAGADLLIAGELVYAAPLVAEKLCLPWVSLILSPFSFFSSIDPSFTVNLPILFKLRKAGPVFYKAALNLGKLATRHGRSPYAVCGSRKDCVGSVIPCSLTNSPGTSCWPFFRNGSRQNSQTGRHRPSNPDSFASRPLPPWKIWGGSGNFCHRDRIRSSSRWDRQQFIIHEIITKSAWRSPAGSACEHC